MAIHKFPDALTYPSGHHTDIYYSSTSQSFSNLQSHYQHDHGRSQSGTTTAATLATGLHGKHSISNLWTPPQRFFMTILNPTTTGTPSPATSRARFHRLRGRTKVEESPSLFAFGSTRTQNGNGCMTISTSRMAKLFFNRLLTRILLPPLQSKSTKAGRSERLQAMPLTLDCTPSNRLIRYLHRQKATRNSNRSP